MLVPFVLLSVFSLVLGLTPVQEAWIGTYNGTLISGIPGPGSSTTMTVISEGTLPGALFIENFMLEGNLQTSYQQFFARQEIGSIFYYCGQLKNYVTPDYIGWTLDEFIMMEWSTTTIKVCGKPEVGGCDAFQAVWTLSIGGELDLTVHLPPPIIHAQLQAFLSPNTSPPPSAVHDRQQCYGRTSFEHYKSASWQAQHYDVDTSPQKIPFPPTTTPGYTCINYNKDPMVRLEFNVDTANNTIWTQITGQSQGSYVALGVDVQFPAMQGANIVWGWPGANGEQCVSTAYAKEYVGTPVPASSFPIWNTSVSVAPDRTVSVGWTRDFKFGKVTNIMWAVGSTPLTSCLDTPIYHGINRAIWVTSFANPEITVPEFMRC